MERSEIIKHLENDLKNGISIVEIYEKYIKPVKKIAEKRDVLLTILGKTTENYTKDVQFLINLNKGE